MKKVIIASENPVKIEVAKQAFQTCFPNDGFEFIGIKAQSGVPDQPVGHNETLLGMKNRIKFAKKSFPNADYFVGQEGGITDLGKEMRECAYIGIADKDGYVGYATTPSFLVPIKIAEYVRNGDELGTANDKFTGLVNSKQAGGVIHTVTEGKVNRLNFYLQAAIIALMELKNKQWYV